MWNPYYIRWIYIKVKKRTSGIFKRSLVIRTLMNKVSIRSSGQVIIRLLGNQKRTLKI